MTIDLDAYFERIGWQGAVAPTYDTLAGLLAAQVERIPFENLDVLLGRAIRLDADGLQRKLVTARRGGYCFEHASLLALVLDELGFACTRHSARVVMATPVHLAPRSHMFLTVELAQGTFVADPGFGRQAPHVPVPLVEGVEARHGEDVHWMARDHGLWVLRTRDRDATVDCWVSDLAMDNLVDFEVSNHYVATHPRSPFVNHVMLRAYTDHGRVTIMNRDITRWRNDAPVTTVLPDRPALRDALRDDFGFDLPEVETMRVPAVPEWS